METLQMRPEESSGAEKVIDAGNGYLLPGLIDAHSHIGIWEEGIGLEGDDTNESSDPATPQLRAIDSVNPRDPAFAEARKNGITTIMTGPGSANPIGGQFAALKTSGDWVDEMILKAPAAMKFALGENPKRIYNDKEETPMTRMATAAIIRENLLKAQEYLRKKEEAAEDEDTDEPDYDFKLESLLPVVRGELPAHFHAHRADDIMTAVRIAREFNLRYAIVHATEAMYVAEPLSRLDGGFMGLITGPLLGGRSKPELANMTFAVPGIAARHGINTALCTDHQVVPVQYIMLCAALAVKSGMTEQAALEAITIGAARAAGISDRVGSIEKGKDADLVLYDRHPFDIFAKVQLVLINGRTVHENA